jgi:hypothetical protein
VKQSAGGAALLVTLLACSTFCDAEVIRNQRGGYALVFPQGWALNGTQKDFTVTGPNQVELSELPLPPPPTQSLKQATQLSAQSFVLIWDCKPTQEAFDLSGQKWKGQVVVLEMRSEPKKVSRQIVLFVAKSGKDFRQLYFSIPTEEWKSHSQQYLAILRTLRFPDR